MQVICFNPNTISLCFYGNSLHNKVFAKIHSGKNLNEPGECNPRELHCKVAVRVLMTDTRDRLYTLKKECLKVLNTLKQHDTFLHD